MNEWSRKTQNNEQNISKQSLKNAQGQLTKDHIKNNKGPKIHFKNFGGPFSKIVD